MIHIPSNIKIDVIKFPCICHFKDVDFPENAPPHFYVVIPANDAVDLILCIITSKVEKREKYYWTRNPRAASSLVKIDSTIFPFLSKDSVIDCNQTQLLSKNDLKKKVHHKYDFNVKASDIPHSLLLEIKSAIKNSPLVRDSIKKLL